MDLCPSLNYIIAEQNEINIKESTKEGKIKCLVNLSQFLNHKPYEELSKQDILDFLSSLKKPVSDDPKHKSIGTYNGRQMILSKFFRWLYNPDESDVRKRVNPPCMNGVRRLPRKEISPYKPSDLWTDEENSIFLKYCPVKRDRAFHSMAIDTSARPHELLNLKIEDIVFKKASSGIQYAEIVVAGKTKSRTLPLIASIPYVKEWIQEHPLRSNPKSWLFVSYSRQNRFGQLTRDGLLKRYEEQYRNRYFHNLLDKSYVPERDKAYIRNMLTKPWNLYVFRHSALTQKSKILKESTLRDHAGWSVTSKMPQVYIHYFGTESSNSLLEAYGIVTNESTKISPLKTVYCPNCMESNTIDARFCASCKMVLKYETYNETLEEQERKDLEIKKFQQKYENDIKVIRRDMELQRLREKTRANFVIAASSLSILLIAFVICGALTGSI
ncbi:MAG: tyrosine-type recombinase/integrase [Thermoproteota archaeon]|nr:tyrosine-type recombinase/integrase [Thermoproteota archaeon]